MTMLFTAGARAAGPGSYYFIAVQNGSYNFKGGAEQLAESYKALQGMVKLADAQNARLTLLFSPQYAVYISSDPARLAELEGWKKTGHEIGAYHQGPETRAWDGYSDLTGEELARLSKKKGEEGVPVPGHKEYFEALERLQPGIRTGCMPGTADKKFLEAAPPVEICGDAAEKKNRGRNEALLLAGDAEKPEKHLYSFHPAGKTGIGEAKEAFSGLSAGVYGASFNSSPSEFGAFYSWLAFLRAKDPQGLRSYTVSSVVAGKLLPEKKAAPAAAEKKAEKKPEEKAARPQPEVPAQEIPRLRPVPSNYGKVGSLVPVRALRRVDPPQRGYCGDGICDAFERAHPGRCPGECK